jgi:hypothetical protein
MRNLILAMVLLFGSTLYSQQNDLKNDIIVTTDGQFLQVKVTKVAEDVITFSYPSENVVNEMKRNGIDKIVFASGRTQNFNISTNTVASEADSSAVEKTAAPLAEAVKTPNYVENTMAIMPMEFEKNGAYNKDLASGATDYFVGLVREKSGNDGIKVLRLEKAIEKLLDAGIGYEKLRQSTPEQLRNALGTEYILYVSIQEMEKDSTVAASSDFMDDFMEDAPTSGSSMSMERVINLRLFGADSEEEAYEQVFSEQVFIKGQTGNEPGTEADSDKWKPSLEYLANRLFATNLFATQQ